MDDEETIAQRPSENKRRFGRSVSLNGVSAVNVDVKKSSNLNDPILDLNVKLNNPIGRLWLAIKRVWKSQNTVIALRFTIPLIVLPIVIYLLWAIWQGRGVSIPMSKLGVIHSIVMENEPRDILILPTSDVFMLTYGGQFDRARKITEKPVIVVGTYSQLRNELRVTDILAYNESDIPKSPSAEPLPRSAWDTILRFIQQFK